ncbi:TIGR03749 family integrating conjugative element protein [Luteimonas sp. XNQY3]|nr:TIGR03749 family integrating conjugative element protein [Luteimonas sp. XNQY3]MCD9007476.1 TIGR03749 family integrating conjugative element protein [Luteimonas sp. XNQY3]
MRHPVRQACAGLLLSVFACMPGHAVEIMRWERLPLAVPLVVGQERVVFIDRNVQVGVPASLGDKLRVQSAGGAVYLRADAPIPPTRLQLQDVATGELILLDIAAGPSEDDQPPLEPVRIVDGVMPPTRFGDAAGSTTARTRPGSAPQAAGRATATRETPVPVVLTRYAAQTLYAPLRTVEPVAGIGRVNVRRDLALDTLLPTLPVRAQALAAWRLEDHWVTAVRLTNRSPRRIALDPRLLQGDFATATFQHPDLGPAGGSTDTTVLYLVTRRRGLAQSVLPALSAIDAATHLTPSRPQGDGHAK